MTTIIYKDGLLAADSRLSAGGMIEAQIRKVHKAGDYIVGFCGEARMLHPLIDALNFNKEDPTRSDQEMQEMPEGEYSAIAINIEGEVLMIEGGKGYIDFADDPQKYYSIGSGSPFALAALDSGLGIVEAMKVAVNRDCFSGGDVHVMALDGQIQVIPAYKFFQ